MGSKRGSYDLVKKERAASGIAQGSNKVTEGASGAASTVSKSVAGLKRQNAFRRPKPELSVPKKQQGVSKSNTVPAGSLPNGPPPPKPPKNQALRDFVAQGIPQPNQGR